MRLAGIAIIGVLGGCVQSSRVACGDEKFCPEDTVCVHATPTVTICAAPDNGECRELADGELCGDAGRCYDHVCVPIACGDQLVDPGTLGVTASEACDDGNTVGGDGCSADCRSDEQCGTGVIDPAKGESCDDGNRLAHDGCSFDCTLETPRWTEQSIGAPQRDGPSLVFDPVRGRVTMFGGIGTDNDTYEWSGLGWAKRPTQFAPPERSGQAAAYDVAHRTAVLFGGLPGGPTTGDEIGDTWLLDDSGWTLSSLSTPLLFPRRDHAMAYDPIRKRVVMFGGFAATMNQYYDETWEWDGAAWTLMPAVAHPSARSLHAMAFDPARGTIVLFGGDNGGPTKLGDLWEWNGTTWTPIATSASPAARSGAAMTTYESGLLLYGGALDGGVIDKMVWRWNGTAWTTVGTATTPVGSPMAMATDFLRDRVVLFGGLTTNVWESGGSNFAITPVTGIVNPIPMTNAAVAFDVRRGRAVVVGEGATFERIDDAWALVAPAPAPVRRRHGLAYDIARDQVVMFGGESSTNTESDQTWVLAAVGASRTWMQPVTPVSPGRRAAHGLAYDAARSRSVLFGGSRTGEPLGDTWEWDGTVWRMVATAGGPSPRYDHALAYDPLRKVTVLFGGDGGFSVGAHNDVWEWNGIAWTRVDPVGPRPIPRSQAALTWNPIRRRLLLVGGMGAGQLGPLDDAWEWNGISWTPVPTDLRPTPAQGHVVMPTSDGTGMIRFSGFRGTPIGETWRLRWESGRIDEQCGGRIDYDGDTLAGCDDPDCWERCTPLCDPGLSCAPTAPRCGDGTPDPRETCQLCPADVAACPSCGDLLCESPEAFSTCPGDCPPP